MEASTKKNVCCFTGHRRLTSDDLIRIRQKLGPTIDSAIESGVNTFIAGGACGFDMLAAWEIAKRKSAGVQLILEIATPFPSHYSIWKEHDQKEYFELLQHADVVHTISPGIYKKSSLPHYYQMRNEYMVDRSGHCIAACRKIRSGSAATLNYIRLKNIPFTNLFQE